MLLEIESSDEFFALVEILKTEGRCWYALHAPRAKDRWLWKVDVEPPKLQTELDLTPAMPQERPT